MMMNENNQDLGSIQISNILIVCEVSLLLININLTPNKIKVIRPELTDSRTLRSFFFCDLQPARLIL